MHVTVPCVRRHFLERCPGKEKPAGKRALQLDDGSYAAIVLRQNVSAAVTVVFFVVVHDAPA